jgi:hypothetical protein
MQLLYHTFKDLSLKQNNKNYFIMQLLYHTFKDLSLKQNNKNYFIMQLLYHTFKDLSLKQNKNFLFDVHFKIEYHHKYIFIYKTIHKF